MKLKINPVFRDLIPELSKDEYSELEASLKKDGCLDSLKIWNNTIIDGHNRYKICTENNIDFEVIEIELDSEDDAKIWIIKNQFGRRNISKATRAMLALELEPLIRERARETQGHRTDLFPNSGKSLVQTSTEKEVAKIAGLGHTTIYEAKKVKESDNEEVKQKMLTGEISIHKAYREVTPKKKTIAKFNGIDVEAIIENMAKKEPSANDSRINKPDFIITEIANKIKSFRSDIAKYVYSQDVLSGVDNADFLLSETNELINELKIIAKSIKENKS